MQLWRENVKEHKIKDCGVIDYQEIFSSFGIRVLHALGVMEIALTLDLR